MKRIGIVGGISWVATLAYYRNLNMMVNQHFGGASSADLVIRSLNFSEVLSHSDNPERVSEMMNDAAQSLADAGAQIIGVGSSTGHKFLGAFPNANVCFIHIGDSIRAHLHEKRITRIGIIGTKFILNESFLVGRINATDEFHIVKPKSDDIDQLNSIIINEIPTQNVSAPSLDRLERVARELKRNGAEAVLLGSTELWSAFQRVASPLPVIDTAEVHCRKIVDAALV